MPSQTLPPFARNFPSIDFSSLDFSKLDLSRLDISKINFPNAQTEELATKVAGILRDAAYVVIGFGVLTVQQVQVRRRELADTLTDNPAVTQLGVTRAQIEDLIANLEARASKLDEKFDAFEVRLDSAVDATVQRLPEQAAALMGQAHEIAKAARKHVRGLIRSAA
jgi:hypothetical protein